MELKHVLRDNSINGASYAPGHVDKQKFLTAVEEYLGAQYKIEAVVHGRMDVSKMLNRVSLHASVGEQEATYIQY